jgi:prophage tail gpP-like protein
MTEPITLTVNGRTYGGWTSVRVSRGIDRCATDFDIEVSERWESQPTPWQIQPFDACTISIGGDLVLTGYVDDYLPSLGPRQHAVRIRGRSRTEDLIDCTPDIPSGQFSGYSLSAIATSIAALFGIKVVTQSAGAATIFADATIERCETAFTFLERLGRLAGVLLTDDEQGRLVLTNTGATRATGRLIEGQNFLSASAVLSSKHRYSSYIVKGQHAEGAGAYGWGEANAGDDVPPPTTPVQTQLQATASDPTVPRFRPRVWLAESQLSQACMQLRANWLRQSAFGQATHADIVVQGYRQPDGSLWRINQLVPVTAPSLGVDQDLLIARVEYGLSAAEGEVTRLRVAPAEAFTPDPGQVRIRKHKGQGGAPIWTGAGGI